MAKTILFFADGAWHELSAFSTAPSPVASVFGRTGTVVAISADYYGIVAAALTGATAAARFVGATTSGAPVTGSFLKGDFVVDQTGNIYVCTVAGSPGTWVGVGGGGGVTSVAKSGSTPLTGPVTFSPGSNITLTQVGQDIAIASTGGGGGSGTLGYVTRSSNTILGTSDTSKAFAMTAAFTQTFTAAATLGAGWWCIIKNDTTNGTTALVLDPNGSETIDGLTTATMYSGETRIIECDGTNFHSQLVSGGYAKFIANGSFVIPYGATRYRVACVGSAGQGGGGPSSAATAKGGGTGGGGGGVSVQDLPASMLGSAGSSITVTVPAGGTSTNRGTGGADGSNGVNGGLTSFGTLVTGGGGGAGLGGTAAVGGQGAGGSAVSSASFTTAGTPAAASGVVAVGAQGAKGAAAGASVGLPSEWGGASGGGTATGTGTQGGGGGSLYGGPGGGAGGSVSTTATGNPGSGGATNSGQGSGAANAGTSGASPTNGGPGTGVQFPYCGQGGGGGGAASGGANAGNGGNGGVGAGGGGGGAALSSANGGNGGDGGRGECQVWYN